jgi:hypothetical protein
MSALLFVLVAGFLGGLAIALLFTKLKGRFFTQPAPDVFVGAPATDVINMAHIRVAGIGGFGLVMAALATTLEIPQIRRSLAMGLVFGILFAAILIWRRRKVGPMTSSGKGMGANTMLAIDAVEPRKSETGDLPSTKSQAVLVTP